MVCVCSMFNVRCVLCAMSLPFIAFGIGHIALTKAVARTERKCICLRSIGIGPIRKEPEQRRRNNTRAPHKNIHTCKRPANNQNTFGLQSLVPFIVCSIEKQPRCIYVNIFVPTSMGFSFVFVLICVFNVLFEFCALYTDSPRLHSFTFNYHLTFLSASAIRSVFRQFSARPREMEKNGERGNSDDNAYTICNRFWRNNIASEAAYTFWAGRAR